MRYLKIAITSLFITFSIYLTICFTLTFWPVPEKRVVKNFDFSSVKESNEPLGEERWMLLRDQSKLFYRFYPSDSKAVCILIHGSGTESRYLRSLAYFLSSNGIASVITPDMRGHGRTAIRKGDIDYIGQLEDDLEDLIKSLKASGLYKKIILGGHSSGGGFALRYLGNSKLSPVDGLVLVSPYLGHEAPTVRPNSGDWVTVAIKRFIGLSMLNNMKVTYFNYLPVLFFNLPDRYKDSLQTPFYSYRMATNFNPNNFKTDIRNINVPTIVLVGEKDESFYVDQFNSVFSESKYSKVEIVSNANHLDVLNSKQAQDSIASFFLRIP